MVANNLTGGFLMMREVFLQSMQAHGGAIVNMTADMRNGMPGMGALGRGARRHGNLTKTAAFEWAAAACASTRSRRAGSPPAGMDTYDGLAKAAHPEAAEATCRCAASALEAEVSAAICFLLSPAAAFITGVTLHDRRRRAARHARSSRRIDHDRSAPFDGFHRAELPEVLEGKKARLMPAIVSRLESESAAFAGQRAAHARAAGRGAARSSSS